MARKRLQAIRSDHPQRFTESLLDYIPRVSQRWKRPEWFAAYAALLEEAYVRPVRAVVAGPPQHGKTVTTTHGLVRGLRVKPGGRSAYATYNAKRCARVERSARIIAQHDGIGFDFRQDDWFDPRTGGSLVWASRNGGLTGEPIDALLVVDDILKDRKEANSATVRRECIDWFDDVAEPRCHPTASIIVMATRWHPDDLSGVLIKRGWRYLNLKALADGQVDEDGRVIDDPLRRFPGEALCEERQTREALEQKRKTNIFSFASLYQGEPRPRGGTVFGEATYYTQSSLPTEGFRVGYGVDFAYTEKTKSDWSVCIEGRFVPKTTTSEDGKPIQTGKLYIVNCDRKQVDAPSFTLTLSARVKKNPGPMRWYVSGTEKGAAQFIKQKLPTFQVKTASSDKLIRATPASEAWNDGRILLPRHLDEEDNDISPEWVADVEDEVTNFTGVKDANDDVVDALAALWDLLSKPAPDLRVGTSQGGRGW